ARARARSGTGPRPTPLRSAQHKGAARLMSLGPADRHALVNGDKMSMVNNRLMVGRGGRPAPRFVLMGAVGPLAGPQVRGEASRPPRASPRGPFGSKLEQPQTIADRFGAAHARGRLGGYRDARGRHAGWPRPAVLRRGRADPRGARAGRGQ